MSNEPRGINRALAVNPTPSLVERLNARVTKGEPDQCWPWTGAMRNGYGCIKHDGRVHSTHKVSFVIAKGEVPEGLIVTHSCDNKVCCNPAHLVAATPGANVREMHERIDVNYAHGSKAYNAVLNDDLVRQIHALKIVHGIGERKIARTLGISYQPVKGVIARKNWKHVPIPTLEESTAIVAAIKGLS